MASSILHSIHSHVFFSPASNSYSEINVNLFFPYLLTLLSLVDADQMVQAYMAHEEVTFKNPSKLHFELALRVFAH